MKKIIVGFIIAFATSSALAVSLQEKLNILAEEVRNLKEQKSTSSIEFGGYGELAYQNMSGRNESEALSGSSNNPNWDAKRWILYASHNFSDQWRMSAEIEIEHANEIFLEQVQLIYKHSEMLNFQAGVLLIPVGITNLFHEPTAFLASQRTELESKIIPSTWRENGIGVFGNINNLRYEFDIVSSLKGSGFSSDGVRSGRQKASKANARSLSLVARVDYDLTANSTIGASYYHGKATAIATDVNHKIMDVHVMANYSGFEIKALYVSTTLSNTDELNLELGKTGTSSVAEKMDGYFVEAGYNLLHGRSTQMIIPFARFESYDTQKEVGATFTKDLSKKRTNLALGLNYKPLAGIVFKADYVISKNDAKSGVNSWNLGIGWNF